MYFRKKDDEDSDHHKSKHKKKKIKKERDDDDQYPPVLQQEIPTIKSEPSSWYMCHPHFIVIYHLVDKVSLICHCHVRCTVKLLLFVGINMVSTKFSVLGFLNSWFQTLQNCIYFNFNLRGLSEPRNPWKLDPPMINNDFTVLDNVSFICHWNIPYSRVFVWHD